MAANLYLVAVVLIVSGVAKHLPLYKYVETYRYELSQTNSVDQSSQEAVSESSRESRTEPKLIFDLMSKDLTTSSFTSSLTPKIGTLEPIEHVYKCSVEYSSENCKHLSIDSNYTGNIFKKCVAGKVSCMCDHQIYTSADDRKKCSEENQKYNLKAIFERMSNAKKRADETLYVGIRYNVFDMFYKSENEVVKIDGRSWRNRVSKFKVDENPSRGFELFEHYGGDIAGIFAYHDDEEQKAKLLIRKLFLYYKLYLYEVVIENLNRQFLMSTRIVPLTFNACFFIYDETRNFTIRLSFKEYYKFLSFDSESKQDTLLMTTEIMKKDCFNRTLYLTPWFEKLPPKLIIRIEVDPVDDDKTKRPFIRRELFSDKCRTNKCEENVTLELEKPALYYPNTDQPIIFDFKLRNHGDFMTHFILTAEISMKCDLSIVDIETHRYHHGFDDIAYFSDSQQTQVATVYPLVIPHNDFIIFYVKAVCSQPFDYVKAPHLKLTIHSLLPYSQQSFTFRSNVPPEFLMKEPLTPLKEINICKFNRPELMDEITFEVFRLGLFDNSERCIIGY
ncbi:hypothetical protein RF11_12527 [Thelohanellus kitauei]|uniref:Uncharacterized protein n=1 Tax=Thelohanellus kitauei TaxID=669202 RepID=A0A0C2MHZ3_THEKT|nr:hypothetical protein RF11_12527 [Thelohanellus kitauei]